MPCSSRKARTFLNNKKACVAKRTPFTIKLLHGSAGYKQPITLGVDAGSLVISFFIRPDTRPLITSEGE